MPKAHGQLSKKSHMLYAFQAVGSSRKRPGPGQNIQPLKGWRDLGVNEFLQASVSSIGKDYYNTFFRELRKLNDVYAITLHCIHHRIRCSRKVIDLYKEIENLSLLLLIHLFHLLTLFLG